MGAMILSFTSIKYLANGVGPYMDGILEMHGYTDVAGRAKPDARAEGAVFNDRR